MCLSLHERELRRDGHVDHHAPAAWSRNKMGDRHSLILSSVFCHAFDSFATNLGTILRGIKRCANTLNLLITPGTARPPPLARTRSVSSTTCSVLWQMPAHFSLTGCPESPFCFLCSLPGHTVTTLTPTLRNSCSRASENVVRNALVAEYALAKGIG